MYIPMRKLNDLKKTNPPSDWPPEDVQWQLRKRGWTFRKLSIAHGYSPGSIKRVLVQPWPLAERIIAFVLRVEPWTIWPSRYDKDHNPLVGGLRGWRRIHAHQSINPVVPFNVKKRRVQ